MANKWVILYKYVPVKRVAEILDKQRLYLNDGTNFNDPFEITVTNRTNKCVRHIQGLHMRMAQHYAQLAQGKEHKYRLLAEATRNGHKMCFTVLYRAKQTDYDAITEEIGNMEGKYIRLHRPLLNQQIPKEENWRQFQINKSAQTITLSELLDEIK